MTHILPFQLRNFRPCNSTRSRLMQVISNYLAFWFPASHLISCPARIPSIAIPRLPAHIMYWIQLLLFLYIVSPWSIAHTYIQQGCMSDNVKIQAFRQFSTFPRGLFLRQWRGGVSWSRLLSVTKDVHPVNGWLLICQIVRLEGRRGKLIPSSSFPGCCIILLPHIASTSVFLKSVGYNVIP